MADDDRTWRDMSRREKFDLMAEVIKDKSPAECEAIMGRVREHFKTRSMREPTAVMNVVLREMWREEHGSAEEWDKAARAMRFRGGDPGEALDGVL